MSFNINVIKSQVNVQINQEEMCGSNIIESKNLLSEIADRSYWVVQEVMQVLFFFFKLFHDDKVVNGYYNFTYHLKVYF